MNVRQLATRVEPGALPAAPGRTTAPAQTPQRDFAGYLERARRQDAPTAPETKISGHAWQRIQQRGISMTETEQHALGEAMQRLDDRGARDALLLRADAAFVVNVPSRTVVTALGQGDLHDRVFTQIDSAMLLDSSNVPTF